MVVARRPGNAGRKWPAEVLTTEEVGLLLAGCSRRSDTGIRNRALIAVLYRGGPRIAECLALEPKDVDAEGRITILHGKNDKRRPAAIDAGALALVRTWEWRRDRLAVPVEAPLFCTLRGGPMSAGYVRTMLRRVAAGAGIRKRVHPHGLRHTFAFELACEGAPLLEIQQLLGHKSPRTTADYINHLAPTAALATIRARTWDPGTA